MEDARLPTQPTNGVGEASAQACRVFGSYSARLRRGLGASSAHRRRFLPAFKADVCFREGEDRCVVVWVGVVRRILYVRVKFARHGRLYSLSFPKSHRVPTLFSSVYVKGLISNTRIFGI